MWKNATAKKKDNDLNQGRAVDFCKNCGKIGDNNYNKKGVYFIARRLVPILKAPVECFPRKLKQIELKRWQVYMLALACLFPTFQVVVHRYYFPTFALLAFNKCLLFINAYFLTYLILRISLNM